MPFRNGLRRAGRAVIVVCVVRAGAGSAVRVPPVGLRGLWAESEVGIRRLGVKSPQRPGLDLSGRMIGPGPPPTDARALLTAPQRNWALETASGSPERKGRHPPKTHQAPPNRTNQDIAIARPH